MTTVAVEKVPSNTNQTAFESKSKRGYHPCDYDTFVKLKKLRSYFWRNVFKVAAWTRWNNKLPHNRVSFQWLRNEQGQKIGKKVLGPRSEPKFLALFTKPDRMSYDFLVLANKLNDHGIEEAYQQARMPTKREDVKPLKLSGAQIDALLKQAEQWFAEND